MTQIESIVFVTGPPLDDERRGQPGARPSWQENAPERAPRPEDGFTRFRINWGFRQGANPRRILAHVCRRGGLDSGAVGSISMDTMSTTFEVSDAIADDFAQRVQRRDKRDPHLVIHRETFRGQRGPMRTRQSR